MHNPSINKQYPIFDRYLNAYDPAIFSDQYYLSDSRMSFKEKKPYQFLERVSHHPIQILLHPLHYSEHGKTYPEIFYEHIHRYSNTIDQLFRVNSTYSKLMTEDLFSYVCDKGKIS